MRCPAVRLNSRSQKPEISIRARVAFFADVPARMTGVYYICYGNPDPPEPKYVSGLKTEGAGVAFTIENPFFRMVTDKASGQINTIALKFAGNPSFGSSMKYALESRFHVFHRFSHHMVQPVLHDFAESSRDESARCSFSMRQPIPVRTSPGWSVLPVLAQVYFSLESRITTSKAKPRLMIRNDERAGSPFPPRGLAEPHHRHAQAASNRFGCLQQHAWKTIYSAAPSRQTFPDASAM